MCAKPVGKGRRVRIDTYTGGGDRRAVDAAYHLGDLVGYGPWPDEVVARLAAEGITDGDPRASWAIASWDGARLEVEIVRSEYDVERTAAAILASDLPDEFAEDLRRGSTRTE